MKRICLAIILPLLSSCATLETEQSRSTRNAPVNEVHGGVVTYNNQGFGADSRRQSAYNKMHDYCSGDYRIIEELNTLSNGSAQTFQGYYGPVTFHTQQKEVKIRFECVH